MPTVFYLTLSTARLCRPSLTLQGKYMQTHVKTTSQQHHLFIYHQASYNPAPTFHFYYTHESLDWLPAKPSGTRVYVGVCLCRSSMCAGIELNSQRTLHPGLTWTTQTKRTPFNPCRGPQSLKTKCQDATHTRNECDIFS